MRKPVTTERVRKARRSTRSRGNGFPQEACENGFTHERHKPNSQPPVVRKPSNPQPYDPPGNMSCEAAAVIARAFDFAAGLHDTHVRLKHLWAAIASEPCTGRSIWFGTHRRPDERAEARVRRRFLRQWGVAGLLRQRERTGERSGEASGGGAARKPARLRSAARKDGGTARLRSAALKDRADACPRVPLAAVTRQVLRRAAQEARELGHPRIGTEHLVLALMRQVRARLFRGAATYYCAYLDVRRDVAEFARTAANPSRCVRTPVRAGDSPARTVAPAHCGRG